MLQLADQSLPVVFFISIYLFKEIHFSGEVLDLVVITCGLIQPLIDYVEKNMYIHFLVFDTGDEGRECQVGISSSKL